MTKKAITLRADGRRVVLATDNARARRKARRAQEVSDNRILPTTDLMRPGHKPKGSNRNGAAPMTGAQRNSLGQRSEWSAPAVLPYSVSVTSSDPRWSQSVSNLPS